MHETVVSFKHKLNLSTDREIRSLYKLAQSAPDDWRELIKREMRARLDEEEYRARPGGA